MVFGIDLHLGQYMSHQAQAAFRIGVEHLAVDGVLVDALGEQFADDEVDFAVVGVVGKAARVGHHAGVDAFGRFLGDVAEVSHAADQAEDEFRRGRYLGMGDDDAAEVFGVEVMVNQNLACRRVPDSFGHGVDAAQGVEVEAADDVGFGDELVGKFLVAVVLQDVLVARHPFQEVGEGVGHNDIGRLVL